MRGWPACLLRWGDVVGREDEGEEEEHYKDRGGGTAHCAGLQMLVLGCWCSDVGAPMSSSTQAVHPDINARPS